LSLLHKLSTDLYFQRIKL